MFHHAFWPSAQAYSGFPPLSITYRLTFWKRCVKISEFSFNLKGTENPVVLILCSWEKVHRYRYRKKYIVWLISFIQHDLYFVWDK